MYDNERLSLGAKVLEEIAAYTSESKVGVNKPNKQAIKQTTIRSTDGRHLRVGQ